MYTPFDPCTGIRTLLANAPMAVCHGLRCTPPPSDEWDFIPPWAANASLPYQMPPLRCPQYVSILDAQCRLIKDGDFYQRSNLDSFCAEQYGRNEFQVGGCEVVRQKMTSRDSMMDLCSAMRAAPIDKTPELFCTSTLDLPSNTSVPLAGYEAYLERVRLYKESWSVARFGEPDIKYPPGDKVVSVVPDDQPNTTVPVEVNPQE
jgi:hypothetical protein